MSDLEDVLSPEPPPFALLYRPESANAQRVEIYIGEMYRVSTIADLPVPGAPVLTIMPYQQIAERGFTCRIDGADLLAMVVRRHSTVELSEALARIPDLPVRLTGAGFDIDDQSYAELVRSVIRDEIGRGEGSNFVIKRSFQATIEDYRPLAAVALFRQLLLHEIGAYWTFICYPGGERTFVGASPERHITLSQGVAVMNPISGTYRYPDSGPDLAGLLAFLADTKETDELYMVLDEELKMMASVCERGGRVVGPYLKEMAHLAHTGYFIEGRTNLDVREMLRRTLFAPTVTGSPLESACRAIKRHEARGRGYYSGMIALITSGPTVDSAILIRTAEISRSGELALGVGATIVRHSDPLSEVAETRAKAAGLTAALTGRASPARMHRTRPDGDARLSLNTRVLDLLRRRNDTLAPFWFRSADRGANAGPPFAEHRVLVVDAEDAFTEMLAHQIRALGPAVVVSRFDEPVEAHRFDLVVVGPGPGDPRQVEDPRIAMLRRILHDLLAAASPFLAICLGHQVLCGLLGFELTRRPVPNQGLQREIELFGRQVRVAFYNTFTARGDSPDGVVEVCRDPASGDVHALRGATFRSFQFHPESVLSTDGFDILRTTLSELLPVWVSDRQ